MDELIERTISQLLHRITECRNVYGDQFVDEVLMMTENRDPLQVRNYLLDEGDHSLVEILEFIYEIEA